MILNIKISYFFIGFLFPILMYSGMINAQETYYYSSGKRIPLKFDNSKVVMFSNSDEKLQVQITNEINYQVDDSSDYLGNYKIIRYNKKLQVLPSVVNNRAMKSKHFGLTTDEGDSLLLTHYVVLSLNDGNDLNSLSNILKKYKGKYIDTNHDWTTIYVEDINDVIKVANEIYESGTVKWCHPDFITKIKYNWLPRDKQYYLHNYWHYTGSHDKDIDALEAWEISLGCEDIRVAVIGTGVEDHPALNDEYGYSRVLPGYSPSGKTDFGRPQNNPHEQCCAGIIAASHTNDIRGIAPNVKIVPVFLQVLPTSSELADAIKWSYTTGKSDVLSCSWGGGDADVVIDQIQKAQIYGRGGNENNNQPGLGSVVIFSAGNDGATIIQPYAKHAIAVGAINKLDDIAKDYVILGGDRYSNIGTGLDLVAYGGNRFGLEGLGNIRTIDLVGDRGYVSGDYVDDFGGTSASCPQVSGAAALILSANPDLTAIEVENILKSTATDLGASGRDDTFGYGKISIYRALQEALRMRNEIFELSEDYLSFSKVEENIQLAFTSSPGGSIPAGVYFGDKYKAELILPVDPNRKTLLYMGDGLSPSHGNSGEFFFQIIDDGSYQKVITYFYFLRYNSGGSNVNQFVPLDPHQLYARKVLKTPNPVTSYNQKIYSGDSKSLFATETIYLEPGFTCFAGGYFSAEITAVSGDIECITNPASQSMVWTNNEISEKAGKTEEDEIINKEIVSSIKNGFKVYPNPNNGYFKLQLDQIKSKNDQIEIFNINGKLIFSKNIESTITPIHLVNEPGYYVIKVKNGSSILYDRIVIY